MTKYIFHLSGDNIPLARYEISCVKGVKPKLVDDLCLAELKSRKGLERLAFTHSFYRLLFVSSKRALKKDIESFDWGSVCKKDYKVFVKGSLELTEQQIGSIIWHRLQKPKVNIKNPKTTLVFFIRDKVYACLFLGDTDKSYLKRNPSTLPGLHPSAMKPKLARAMVNLTGSKSGVLFDPFCGAGGLLIEAAFLGFKPVGYDIDYRMLEKARMNFKHFKINDFVLLQKDALSLNSRIRYLVTDLPYGVGTKSQHIEKLYLRFLKLLDGLLIKRAVIGFPTFVDFDVLIKKTRLKAIKKFSYYIHKRFSKEIVVLEKDPVA